MVRVDGCQPKGPRFYPQSGGPKRFHDSFNFVFDIVGECISCAADTHLATDLTSQTNIRFVCNADNYDHEKMGTETNIMMIKVIMIIMMTGDE